jgi:hypothetical protein
MSKPKSNVADPLKKRMIENQAECRISHLDWMERIGDRLAKKHGYSHLRGEEAVFRYLVERHHWPVDYVRHLNEADLELLLGELP